MTDLNAERKRRAGLADNGRCPHCGRWRLLCQKIRNAGVDCEDEDA
jgi:hypothetical protein